MAGNGNRSVGSTAGAADKRATRQEVRNHIKNFAKLSVPWMLPVGYKDDLEATIKELDDWERRAKAADLVN